VTSSSNVDGIKVGAAAAAAALGTRDLNRLACTQTGQTKTVADEN